MTFKLPKTWMGERIEGSLERVLASSSSAGSPPQQAPNPITPLVLPDGLDKSQYIKVPNTNLVIGRQELYKGQNWEGAHRELATQGLFMPRVNTFMRHFLNVRDASNGVSTLYDAENNPLPQTDALDLWKYLSTNHRGGCWTWLDALFKEGVQGKPLIETDHRVNPNLISLTQPEELELYHTSDAFVSLDFNSQGLPKRVDANQRYVQGQNIKFYSPVKNAVAWFVADFVRAYLICYGDPTYANSRLGVFPCAEGTAVAKNGGNP